MWDRLRAVDIEQAKQEVARRRVDILARHAREIEELQASHAEIEALHGLIAAFAVKFKTPGNGASEAPRAATLPDPLVDGNGDADASVDPDGVASADSSAALQPAELAEPPDTAVNADPKPAAAQATPAAAPARRVPPSPPGELPRTNFEAFSRAIAKASY